MFRPLLALLAALAATLLALPAEAQWKWKDKSGRVQYSDLPPPLGTPEQDILGKPGSQKSRASVIQAAAAGSGVPATASAASTALSPRTVEPELEAKRKKADAEVAAKAKAEDAKITAARADNCTRAKAQMATLDSGIRLARANAKGEREFLDDKQRADETKRVRDTIAADCR